MTRVSPASGSRAHQAAEARVSRSQGGAGRGRSRARESAAGGSSGRNHAREHGVVLHCRHGVRAASRNCLGGLAALWGCERDLGRRPDPRLGGTHRIGGPGDRQRVRSRSARAHPHPAADPCDARLLLPAHQHRTVALAEWIAPNFSIDGFWAYVGTASSSGSSMDRRRSRRRRRTSSSASDRASRLSPRSRRGRWQTPSADGPADVDGMVARCKDLTGRELELHVGLPALMVGSAPG